MLNSCSGKRTVAVPSVFELRTFTKSTKYPYSKLARNYIVQTSLAWLPPRLPCCPLATTSYWTVTTRLSTVAHAYRFPIGRPLQYTGLLLATHFSKDLPLSLPHSADISAFRHALSRQYTVVAIRHVSANVSSCRFGGSASPA